MHVTTHAGSGTTLYTTTRIKTNSITNTTTQLPGEETLTGKKSNDFFSNKTNILIIIGAVGLARTVSSAAWNVGCCIYLQNPSKECR